MIKLSVVIPAYKEEVRIKETLLVLKNYLSKQSYEWEVIVCVDGSPDNTAPVVADFQAQMPNLQLIDNKQNHGKGWVVREGMLKATGEYRLFTDADNSTSIEQIEKFWPFAAQGFDIVIGSIELPGAKINEHAQWYQGLWGIGQNI